jgi:phage pi2 protein 07
MSKRTNAFQKTILFIHEQLKDSGTSVSESTFLPELNIEPRIDREIDVLIEKEDCGILKRIALECRGRRNKDDIIWIDSLIGKYLNLKVDKVIAISSSGFSKSATLKANAHNIELRTLKEIRTIDWNNEFIKIGMSDWQLTFTIEKVVAETESGVEILIKSNHEVLYEGETGSFSEFFEAFKDGFWDKLFKRKFNESIGETYKVREDLSKIVQITHRVPIPDVQIIVDKVQHKIKALNLHVKGVPIVKDLSTRQFRYIDSLISKTQLVIDDNKSMTFYTSHAKSNHLLNVSIDRRDKMKGKKR